MVYFIVLNDFERNYYLGYFTKLVTYICYFALKFIFSGITN